MSSANKEESFLEEQRFGGVVRLYGNQAFAQFQASRVLVVGVGGVGCWAVEALARSGVKLFTLVDLDELCITNTNRQLHALGSEIGQPKVMAMAKRIQEINPCAEVVAECDFYTEENGEALLQRGFDLVLDCIDRVRPKVHLAATARRLGIPLVMSGAAGGRVDPGQIYQQDLARVGGDALLRQVRKRLREQYNWPAGNAKQVRQSKKFGVSVVASLEQAVYPTCDGEVSRERADTASGAELRLNCDSGYGTSCAVVASFGLRMAAVGLQMLAEQA